MKYLIKHWLNVDCLAEAIVDETEINTNTNDLKKYQTPNSKFKFKVIQGDEKIIRTTFEKYDEKSNITSQGRTRNK
jgi:hypothetical protein